MPKTILTNDQIADIRRRAAAGEKQSVLAIEFGVDKSRVSRIASGESFRAGKAISDGSVMMSMTKIRPDPDQPRKYFDATLLADLAASIKEIGLQQPIGLRRDPDRAGHYIIVFGERRFRAFQLNGATEIPAHVREFDDLGAVRLSQIIENLQRANINPVEEGRAFRATLDETGWSIAELARKLGLKHPVKVTDRLSLLNLRPEYQDLVASGQLTQSQGFEMSRLPPVRQDDLFRALKAGKTANQSALRQYANAMIEADSQTFLLDPETAPTPSAEELAEMSRLERKIDQVIGLVAQGFNDNEIVVARKIDPSKADTYADKLMLIQKAIGQMERALRHSAAQLSFKAAA